MKRAWRDRRVRVIAVSAVVLAASTMTIIPAARTDLVRSCGCGVAGGPCAPVSAHGVMAPEDAPPSIGRTWRKAHSGQGAAAGRSRGFPLTEDDDGIVLKFSLYRGLGGGLTGSFTEKGMAFTFESGLGVGGSFSAGSTTRRPDVGVAVEGRASMSSRIWLLRLPDFGFSLSPKGRLQGYMDAKAGNFRTRFQTKPIYLAGGGGRSKYELPKTRRSWSLGTELKLAGTYTLRFPWGGLFDVWTGLLALVLGDWNPRAPPIQPVELLAYPEALNRGVLRGVFWFRRHGTEYRSALVFRSSDARMVRSPPMMNGGRRPRPGRSGRTASSSAASQAGSRTGSVSAAADEDEPAGVAMAAGCGYWPFRGHHPHPLDPGLWVPDHCSLVKTLGRRRRRFRAPRRRR